MIPLVEQIDAVKRMGAQNAGRWRNIEAEVRDDDGTFVARADSRGMARYIAGLHNIFLPLANLILTQRKKLVDRKAMSREIACDDKR